MPLNTGLFCEKWHIKIRDPMRLRHPVISLCATRRNAIYEESTLHVVEDAHTGWRRRRGCLKLQVIFRRRATNYRALLRKMTYKDKTCCGSTPPCTCIPLIRKHRVNRTNAMNVYTCACTRTRTHTHTLPHARVRHMWESHAYQECIICMNV